MFGIEGFCDVEASCDVEAGCDVETGCDSRTESGKAEKKMIVKSVNTGSLKDAAIIRNDLIVKDEFHEMEKTNDKGRSFDPSFLSLLPLLSKRFVYFEFFM